MALLGIGSICQAQSIITEWSGRPNRNILVLEYDDTFLFLARHHGDHRDFGGNTEPGLFVHSKRHNQWRRILKISTKDGIFGSSNSAAPEDQKRMMLASVGWNFTYLVKQDYADMPLRTSGSLVFPSEIVYLPDTDQYRFGFMTDWDVRSARTYLFFSRSNLLEAFEKSKK